MQVMKDISEWFVFGICMPDNTVRRNKFSGFAETVASRK
jgi:hypothetical protein